MPSFMEDVAGNPKVGLGSFKYPNSISSTSSNSRSLASCFAGFHHKVCVLRGYLKGQSMVLSSAIGHAWPELQRKTSYVSREGCVQSKKEINLLDKNRLEGRQSKSPTQLLPDDNSNQ